MSSTLNETIAGMPVIHRYTDAAAVAVGGAEIIATRLVDAIVRSGRASFALAGGSTPGPLYKQLAASSVPWERVHIYFGDERCVPPDDPKSNYRMARETLLDHVRVPPDQVHRIEGELPPAEAAARYAELLAATSPIDVVLLGMGDDGHTASLFPATPEPPPGALAIATTGPVAPHDRVTMTYGAITAAHAVLLQVCGAGKASRLAQVYDELKQGRPTLPAARIGRALWLVDEAAASKIDPERDTEPRDTGATR